MKSKCNVSLSVINICCYFCSKKRNKISRKALKKERQRKQLLFCKALKSLIRLHQTLKKLNFSLKGNVYLDLADKNRGRQNLLSVAAAAYSDLIAAEQASGIKIFQ
jgi:hypothetical protein